MEKTALVRFRSNNSVAVFYDTDVVYLFRVDGQRVLAEEVDVLNQYLNIVYELANQEERIVVFCAYMHQLWWPVYDVQVEEDQEPSFIFSFAV